MSKIEEQKFVIDAIENKEFNGYTTNDFWNGFEVPLFTKEVSEDILKCSENNGYSWEYIPSDDYFIVHNYHSGANNSYAPETYYGKEYMVNGESKKLYSIGGRCWVWNRSEEDM